MELFFNKYSKQPNKIINIFIRLVRKNYWNFLFFFAVQVGASLRQCVSNNSLLFQTQSHETGTKQFLILYLKKKNS